MGPVAGKPQVNPYLCGTLQVKRPSTAKTTTIAVNESHESPRVPPSVHHSSLHLSTLPHLPTRPPPQTGLTCCQSVLAGTVCVPHYPLFVHVDHNIKNFAVIALVAPLILHNLQFK